MILLRMLNLLFFFQLLFGVEICTIKMTTAGKHNNWSQLEMTCHIKNLGLTTLFYVSKNSKFINIIYFIF